MQTHTDINGLTTETLRLYGLDNFSIIRIGGVDSTNFRVNTASTSYALHLYAARHDRAAIISELVWLGGLRNDAALTVPEPVPNEAGDLVSSVRWGGTETLCTLMRWLEGNVPPTVDTMTPGQLEQTGTLMARLHDHAQEFKVLKDFSRPTYDEPYFRNRFATLQGALQAYGFDQNVLAAFKTSADAVLIQFGYLGRTSTTFGLIHADFHSGNYVLNGNIVSIIDFGRCGFGFYLHDLALALTEMNETQRGNFLRGYESIRSLPDGYANLNQMFLVLAYLDNLGTLASNPEEIDFIVNEMRFVTKACQRAAASLP